MKCLCKNGQNGDPLWKKSCHWSFQNASWSKSDVKSVQCKARTVSTKPTTTTSTTTTTTTTTATTTTTTTEANPNTHHICREWRDTWKPCSNCYTYVQTHDYFFSYEPSYGTSEDHTCTYSISKKCDPNFLDRGGLNCKTYKNSCQSGGRFWYIEEGIMTEDGFMTGLNCPECGCTEENGPIRADFSTLS